MKKIFKIIAIVSVVLLVGSVVLHKQCDKTPISVEPSEEFKVPVEEHHDPIIKNPFKRHAQPVKAQNLPIPRKDIDKTIAIGEGVVLVIDKKGEVYTTKDTPKDISIKVTKWKPKALAFESRWGATLAMTIKPDMYFCLSWDFLRIGGVHFGVDAGVASDALNGMIDDFLLGVAGRVVLLKKNEIYGTFGYEFTHKTIYVGITVIL